MTIHLWKRVVFSCEVGDDDLCPVCGLDYTGACECPGPTQDDLFEYMEVDGELFAKPLPEI